MKKSISISALIVIFVAEFVGLLGIMYLRYCLDVQTTLYDSMIEQVFEAESDVEQIRSLLYKYEYNMSSVLNSTVAAKEETMKALMETEIEIRNQMISHGEVMKTMKRGSEKEALFRSVNDDVLHYLNFNVVLLSMKGTESEEDIAEFTSSYIFPLMSTKRRCTFSK